MQPGLEYTAWKTPELGMRSPDEIHDDGCDRAPAGEGHRREKKAGTQTPGPHAPAAEQRYEPDPREHQRTTERQGPRYRHTGRTDPPDRRCEPGLGGADRRLPQIARALVSNQREQTHALVGHGPLVHALDHVEWRTRRTARRGVE